MTSGAAMKHLLIYALPISGLILSACADRITDFDRPSDFFDRRPDISSTNGAAPSANDRGIVASGGSAYIEARVGDTIESIAARAGVTGAELARTNGVPLSFRPVVGQRFALPKGYRVENQSVFREESLADPAQTPSESSSPFREAGNTNDVLRHRVLSGESAFSIARDYGVSATALAEWNNLNKEFDLRVGQQLLIPNGGAAPRLISDTGTPEFIEELNSGGSSNTNGGTSLSAAPTPEPAPSGTEESPAPANTSTDQRMVRPVEGTILRPYASGPGGNEGIDFGASEGASVRAAAAGTIALISTAASGSKVVLLRHPDNIYTVYSNLTDVMVARGDKLTRGQKIGAVARVGSESFLHFEVRNGTDAVDPGPFLGL